MTTVSIGKRRDVEELKPHTTKKTQVPGHLLSSFCSPTALQCCWTLFFFHQKPYWLRLSGRHYSDSDAGSYFSIWPAKAKPISVKDNSSEKNTSTCGRTQSHDLPTLLWIYILNVQGSSFINHMFWHISLDYNNKRTKFPKTDSDHDPCYIIVWYFTSAGSSFKVTKLQDATRWEASMHAHLCWSLYGHDLSNVWKGKGHKKPRGWLRMTQKKLSISS